MTNATAVAPKGATKAPARNKAAPAPAPEPTDETASNAAITDDEKTVAAAASQQLQSIYEAHWADMPMHASGLLHIAIRDLSGIQDAGNEVDRGEVFHNAAAYISGALAIGRAARPEAAFIDPMDNAFSILESASISYGFVQEPCEALSVGIRAGARPFREQPMPPIRREPESAQATHLHNAKDVQIVFETLATQALTLRDFLLEARTELDANGGTVRAANDMFMAQNLAAFIGSMADEMCGGRFIGSPASWATMDGILPIGGAS